MKYLIILFAFTIALPNGSNAWTVDEFFEMNRSNTDNKAVDDMYKRTTDWFARGIAQGVMHANATYEFHNKKSIYCAPDDLPINGTMLIQLADNWRNKNYKAYGEDYEINLPFSAVAVSEFLRIFSCEK